MHGIISPAGSVDIRRRPRADRVRDWLRQRRMFIGLVIVPTLLVAAYFYLVASDQYVSETHIIVRSTDAPQTTSTGLSQFLSMAGGTSPAQAESMSVADYLSSHDVVDELRTRVGLIDIYRRPGVDWFSRIWSADPAPERLEKYYLDHTKIKFHTETGITSIEVRTFRPEDSLKVAQTLLDLGDARINSLNRKSYSDAIANSQRQLSDAETGLRSAQANMSRYRQVSRDIDPEGTGRAQTGLVTQLTASLSQARAQLASMNGLISTSSPQYVAVQQRVRALEAQVAAQSQRLAGSGSTIASTVAGYNDLELRQQFAARRYEAAATAVQRAREQAIRKQLYVVRVVNPNRPVKSLYPERGRIVLTVFVGLLLAFGIGWLIVAGSREHAA